MNVSDVVVPRAQQRKARRSKITSLSRNGLDGEQLKLHRALARRHLHKSWVWSALFVPLLVSLGLILLAPKLLDGWHFVISYFMPLLGLDGTVGVTNQLGGVKLPISVTWLELKVGAPTMGQWYWGFGLTALACLVSFFLPASWIPLAYVLRIGSIVMASALAYFEISPATFPYSPADHISTLIIGWLGLAIITPLVFGLTYNILEFKRRSKALLLILSIVFMLIAAPLLALAHAIILTYGSLLYQPVLFLFFSLFPGLSALICFYSWAMTWEPERNREAVL